jgi:pimeloyl-ACP methyl ester carboxylesterase
MNGDYHLPDRVSSRMVDTARLRTHVLECGSPDDAAVVFLHGNIASSLFWDETLAALPAGFRGIALDLRAFGDTETQPIDATRGMGDFADDVAALIDALGITEPVHLVGWSTGGLVAMHYTADHPVRVASLSLVDSVPPHGFGGTRDVHGTPTNPMFSGTGAGIVPPEVVQRIKDGDTTSESELSPRVFMNAFYWKQGYKVDPAREDAFVAELLKSAVGEGTFPGDVAPCDLWPGFAPGTTGVNNALSGKYANVLRLKDATPKPPILWVHGTDDLVVSDASMYDMGHLGQLGAIPDWPGPDVYPAQPMVAQMRAFLDDYQARGGTAREVAIDGAAHGPHIDHPEEFQNALFAFLDGKA